MKKFKIVSLGCRTNQYEAQGFRDQLLSLGMIEGEGADVCVVNTCTVTAKADRDSRKMVEKLARENPNAQIFVTGCASDGDIKGFQQLPQVVEVKKNIEKETLLQRLDPSLPEFSITQFQAHTRAFVKVQDGCNSFCSYCIIPYVRGRSRSRPLESILKEVRTLILNGYQEIVLTGVNIGDYASEGKNLAAIVKEVDQVPGLKRLRLSSIDPDEVDDDLLQAVIEGENTAPSMHIVLQSGSNQVLKRMNRKYTRQQFLEAVDRLKQHNPDFTITTDIIVGFPGETELDFQETLETMKEVRFAKVHMFPYSVRKRTRAALFPDTVDPQVIQERKQRVLRLNEKLAMELREPFIGRTMGVLTEERDGEYIVGHTSNFLPVLIKDAKLTKNQMVQATFTNNSPKGLIGDAVIYKTAV